MEVHPVFNVGLLKKYQGELIRPDPVEVDGELEYEVEKILGYRHTRRGTQYLVSWKGYDESENMWIAEDDIEHAQDVLRDYQNSLH